jgi:diguanylate cyclase (GGDEF)-like protein
MNDAKKILLIDDDPAIASLIALLVSGFRRGPFVLEHADDYAGGLRRLLSGGYALCLLDYHLGPRDGLELLREAKAANCATPIILLTGSGNEETDLAAMASGAADYLEKTEVTRHGLERTVCYALEMADAMAQLRELATRDKLTGTLNRREFDRRLQEEWHRYASFQRPLALVMLDLDRFKQINDTHGHPIGDEVLRHVAHVLLTNVRPVDCLARYGGDEFALIMVETDRARASATANRLRTLLANTPCLLPANQLMLGIRMSAGVATATAGMDAPAMLIAAADAALYAAKRDGVVPA